MIIVPHHSERVIHLTFIISRVLSTAAICLLDTHHKSQSVFFSEFIITQLNLLVPPSNITIIARQRDYSGHAKDHRRAL